MGRKVYKTTASTWFSEYKRQITFTVNIALLLSGIAMSVSGLIIQYNYHLQKSPAETVVLSLDHPEWNAVHVWTSFVFAAFASYHIWAHRKWYRSALNRNINLRKRKRTLLLTIMLFVVAISGLISFLIYCSGGSAVHRLTVVEIHDKVAILFFIIVFFHTAKRFKWYLNTARSKRNPA